MVRPTKAERRGCGAVGDLGLWNGQFIPGLQRVADFIRARGARPAIQIGHSGRKARLTLVSRWGDAAKRADRAGFDITA